MNRPARQLHSIAERYLSETHALFPQEASDLGLHQYDGDLGANDAVAFLEHRSHVERALREIEALPEAAFTGDAWLDRRGMLAMLRTDLFFNERERWRNDPQTHVNAAIDSIFHLIARNPGRLKKVVPAIESRLRKIPDFLAAGAAVIRKPVPLWKKLALASCNGAVEFLAGAAEEVSRHSENPDNLKSLFAGAERAFERFATALEKKEPGPASGFSVGRQAFEFLVRERTGLRGSLPEIRAMGENLVAELNAALAEEARKFGRRKSEEIVEEAAQKWELRSGSLLQEYQTRTSAVRDQFEEADLVSFPKGERCLVVAAPPFLKHQFPTAAYFQPGAYDRDQTGIFWVNDLSLEQRDPEKRAAEIRQHFGLDFTCAHEAYPGHHLQFAIQNQHPSKLRRLFHHAIFYEGWTLWCEKMAVDERVIEFPEARLIQLQDGLWRAHRIVIDCGLHDGSLTYAAACKRLQEGAGFTAARARGDVNWYTSSPTVPMSYLLGRLEVERLHAYLVQREGWTLRRFNDWSLSFGAIPWSWIWESRLRPDPA